MQHHAYKPESNRALEQAHSTLQAYLRLLGDAKNLESWDKLLPFTNYSYNTQIHLATNLCPFELIFGIRTVIWT